MFRRLSKGGDAPTESPAKTPRRSSLGNGNLPPLTPTQEGSERVKVFVRVRPPREDETASGLQIVNGDKTVILPRKNESVVQTDFQFDKVLGTSADQQDVYKAAVEPIVEDVLRGYNGTIMAYGQTGAGKTYTLSSVSSADNIGMMPRAAAHIFSGIHADPSHIYNVVMAYAQIYREQILDLIKPESGNLQIREGAHGVFISGIEEQPVLSVKDCLALMQHGDQNRKTALTQMNAHSSRSHAIVMLTVVKRRRQSSSATAIADNEEIKVGKLFIVDLAGSERLKKSLSTGLRADEAKAINLSLTTLGLCINSRADRNSKHTPFRDSKLTRLLQESLGGNAKTSLVVAIADAHEHLDETLQSIQFGQRAMRVQTKARINESVGKDLLDANLLKRLSSMDIATCAVDANLLEKEEELRKIQEALAGEKERNQKAIADLEAARMNAQQNSERELTKAQAKLTEQQQQAQKHEAELTELRDAMAKSEKQSQRDIQALQGKLRAAESDLQIRVATLTEEIHGLQGSIKSLEADVLAAKQQATAAEKAKASAESKAIGVQKGLKAKVEELVGELSLAHAKVEEHERKAGQQSSDYEVLLDQAKQQYSEVVQQHVAAQKDAAASMHQIEQLQSEMSVLEQSHAAELEGQLEQFEQLQAELQQLKDQASMQRQETSAMKEMHAEEIRDLTEKLVLSEVQREKSVTEINSQAAETIETLKAELSWTQKERAEAEKQATKAHEQAAEAHNQAAAATQERLEHTQQLQEEHDERVRDLRARHEEQLSSLQTAMTLEMDSLQHRLNESKQSEGSLRKDLDELYAKSTQRTRELTRQLEAREAREDELTSRGEASENEWQQKVLQMEQVHAAKLSETADQWRKLLEERVDQFEAERTKNEEQLHLQEDQAMRQSKRIVHLEKKLEDSKAELVKEREQTLLQVEAAENARLEIQEQDTRLQFLAAENAELRETAGLTEKLRAERNTNAQDLAMVRKHKHDLEGQYKGLEAANYKQQILQGRALFDASYKMLDEALVSLKINFLVDSKARMAFANMQGRTPSMSPLGGLGPRGIHYSPSPLGRSSSFISVASDKSSTYESTNEGPLGSGALIPAAYPPRPLGSTPRQNGSTPRQNGIPPKQPNSTPRQLSRSGSTK